MIPCTTTIDVSKPYPGCIPLGVWDTDDVRQVRFDLSRWVRAYGGGVARVIASRPGEKTEDDNELVYEVAQADFDAAAGLLVWTFDATDTAIPGYGRCGVIYTPEAGGRARTVAYRTIVADTIGRCGETVPSALEDWYNRMLDAAQAAQDAAAASQESAETSQESAEAAEGWAQESHRDWRGIADMIVSAHMIDPGTYASVEKVVDEETRQIRLSFGVPRGQEGARGIQGVQGIQGEKGDPGESGIIAEVAGMYYLTVDSSGALWAYFYDDGSGETDPPPFVYDAETGNLYYELEV